MKTDNLYAIPKQVTELAKCHFYHTMHVPGHGVVEGEWDLRSGLHRYLGRVDLTEKRVLDVGTASGLVAFSVEERASEVIAFDLSPEQDWDIVPYSGLDLDAARATRKAHINKINNSFWLNHNARDSSSWSTDRFMRSQQTSAKWTFR